MPTFIDFLKKNRKHLTLSQEDFVSHAKTMDSLFLFYKEKVVGDVKVGDQGNVKIGYSFEVPKKPLNISRVNTILEGIEPKAFKFSFTKKFAEEDHFMHPYRYSDFVDDPKTWQKIVRRAGVESNIGGQMKFPQTLFASIAAASATYGIEAVKNNIFLQYLKFYLDSFSEDIFPSTGTRASYVKGELFREGRGGRIIAPLDSAGPTRCLCCLICATNLWDGKYPADALEEVFHYIFQDPYARTIEVGKAVELLKQTVFCLTPIGKGQKLSWDPIPKKKVARVPPSAKLATVDFNDPEFYQHHRAKINEDIKHLITMGLPKLSVLYSKIITAQVNNANLNLAAILQQPQYITGFMRTHRAMSHKLQAEFGEKLNVDMSKVTFGPFIADQWREAIEHYYQNKFSIKTKTDFFRILPTLLTTKSAGYRAIRVAVLSNVKYPGFVWNKKLNAYQGDFTLNDKISHFFYEPGKFLDKKYFTTNSKDNPFTIGTRDVPAKLSRAIFVMPLDSFFKEAIVPYVYDMLIIRSKEDDIIRDPLDGKHNFAIGSEIGLPLIDHLSGIVYSAMKHIFIAETDFSKFDSTEKEQVRGNIIKGVQQGIDNSNLSGSENFLGYPTLAHAFLHAQIDRAKLWFRSSKDSDPMLLNMLFSGEFATTLINSFTNRAFALDFRREAERTGFIFKIFKLLRWMFTGDDAVSFFEVLQTTGAKVTFKAYSDMINLMVEVAGRNGLILNPVKTVLRRAYYEYLKKMGIYGYSIPLYNQTTELAAENPMYDQDPMIITLSMAATLIRKIERGWNHDYYNHYIKYFWNFKRAVKYQSQKTDRTVKWYLLPFTALYTPITFKGAGQIPFTLVYPSKDGVIAAYCYKYPQLKMLVNNAAKVMNIPPPNVIRKLTESMMAGKTVPPNAFQDGLKFLQELAIDPIRVTAAIQAIANLRKAGVTPPDKTYDKYAEEMFKSMFSGNQAFLKVRAAIKEFSGFKYRKAAQRKTHDVIKQKYGWMRFPQLFKTSYILDDRYNFSPFPVQDEKIQILYRKIGYNRSKSDIFKLSPEALLSFIRQDKGFPRYWRAEQIYAILTHPNILPFPDRIINVLVSIGLKSSIASQTVQRIQANADQFKMLTQQVLSTTDMIIGQLDLSRTSYLNIVNAMQVQDRKLQGVLYQLGFAYAICEYFRTGEFRKVDVRLTDDTVSKMSQSFSGKRNKYKALAFLGIYPTHYVS